ncbi:alpha/beta-hydrolase [Pholiota molesta]|nr:alpha/beta-hydrolase [Pholiota molesta]
MTTPCVEAWLVGPRSTNFYTRTYSPPTKPIAVLVFVHGAAEHSGRYTDMHTALCAEHGIAVFAYDQRGFGRIALDVPNRTEGSAYGKTNWGDEMDDLDWAVRTAHGEFPDAPVFLMGTSMGGGIVLGYLARSNRPADAESLISGVVAGSPCVKLTKDPPKAVMWIAHQILRLHPYLMYPVRNNPNELSRNKETNASYETDPLIRTPGSLRSLDDMITQGGKLLTDNYVYWPVDTPVLFLHGTGDQVTSPVAAQVLYEKLPANHKHMILYPDARHELHNEPEGVREKSLRDIVAFINAPNAK